MNTSREYILFNLFECQELIHEYAMHAKVMECINTMILLKSRLT